MNHWGKVLGFIFGYMVGRLPGAILGLILGFYFDRGYSRAFDRIGGFTSLMKNAEDLKQRPQFFHTLFAIMGHIAKSSGRVTESDIALATALMDKLQLKGDIKKEAQTAYTQGKKSDFPIKETVKEFKQFSAGRAELTLVYLELQIQAALINGELNEKANSILTVIAKTLNYSPLELASLIKQIQAANRFRQAYETEQKKQQQYHHRSHQNQRQYRTSTAQDSRLQLNNAYAILGIDQNTPEKAAKKHYKKLMAQHHPDKLFAQGLPEEAMVLAKEKTQDIQSAWQMIKTHRGWK